MIKIVVGPRVTYIEKKRAHVSDVVIMCEGGQDIALDDEFDLICGNRVLQGVKPYRFIAEENVFVCTVNDIKTPIGWASKQPHYIGEKNENIL